MSESDPVPSTAAPGDPAPDAAEVEAAADRVMTAALGWVDLMAIHLGSRLGWYDALVSRGPLDAAGLAAATGTDARYAREWLEQQAASGWLVVEEADPAGPDDVAAARRFRIEAAFAEVLTDGASRSFMEPVARMFAASAARLPDLLDAYRSGGGVSWEQLGRHAREAQAEMNRPWLEAMPEFLAEVPRVRAALTRPGARVADLGMGAGWSSIALAAAHPGLRVEGFDVDEASVALAKANAEAAGLADRVAFHLVDAARLAEHGPFDAVFAFECLHDMPHPVEVLAGVRAALAPDGVAVIMDEATEDAFAPDAPPVERLLYGWSLFVCLPDGMSHGESAATGTVMRVDTLRGYAQRAGWRDVRVIVPEFGLWRFYELVG
ncbi:SAM-dependent methyltransferase [Agromyces sp. MMS24-JH15]|uniref:SAM-dependent methyltransferase n=1 Tax=Agromyces sp. MMS24-JH15 TaxID=3243765 RepID=UPI0037490791